MKSYKRNYLKSSDKTINVNNWSNIRFYKKHIHFNIRKFSCHEEYGINVFGLIYTQIFQITRFSSNKLRLLL